jgi:hypothetical protein
MSEPILFQKDSRGRLALGPLLDHDRYLGVRDSEGRIILEPAVVLTTIEQRLLADQRFIARMTEAANQPTEDLDLEDL